MIYHVLNRAHSRRRIFYSDRDYLAFVKVLGEALERWPGVRLLAMCVMPNHWHLVLWPSRDGELSDFMRWVTQTHTQRWRHAKNKVGDGALYQGRFKSFIVQEDRHLLVLCRYVERNPVRGKRPLVKRAQDWRWNSAWIRLKGDEELRKMLCEWPVDRPRKWLSMLNEEQAENEEGRLRVSLERNRPFGDATWMERTIKRLGLQHTVRPPWRPRKEAEE
jgi:putative transposase